MNQVVYEQLKFDSKKKIVYVYLFSKKTKLKPKFSLEQVKLKFNNVFVDKLMHLRFNLTIYNIIILFANKFIWYQIIIYNLLKI